MSRLFVGRWLMISDDAESRTAEFTDAGELTYFVDLGDRELVLRLHYRTEGTVIITSQEGAENEIRATFAFADDDTLVLDYGGERFTFRRLLG